MSVDNAGQPTQEDVANQLEELRNQLAEQEHRWLPILLRLAHPDTWKTPARRNASLRALISRLLAPALVAGVVGGLITSCLMLFQFMEMRKQTNIMNNADFSQRRTELLILLYASETAVPVRSMALVELLSMKLPYLDLRDIDLSRVSAPNANLSGADMEGAILASAQMPKANLEGTRLRVRMDHQGDDTPANLSRTLLQGASGTAADFTMAFMLATDITGAKLRGADFSHTTGAFLVAGSHYAGAKKITCANPRSHPMDPCIPQPGVEPAAHLTDLRDAIFFHSRWGFSDLTGVVASGAELVGATFSGAQISQADFSSTVWNGGDLRCARGTAVSFNSAQMNGSLNFSAADLRSSDWRNAKIDKIDFTGATLTSADFNGLVIEKSADGPALIFAGTNLRGSVGLTSAHWAEACIDDATETPEGAPATIQRCAPAPRPPLPCWPETDNDNRVKTNANLFELIHNAHISNKKWVDLLKAEAAKRNVIIVEN